MSVSSSSSSSSSLTTCGLISRVSRLKTAPDQTAVGPEMDGHDISAGLDDVRGRVSSTERTEHRWSR